MRWLRLVIPAVFAVSAVVYAPPASANHNPDQHENMDLLVNEPNATGAVNSDIAFWGTVPMSATTTGSGSSTTRIRLTRRC